MFYLKNHRYNLNASDRCHVTVLWRLRTLNNGKRDFYNQVKGVECLNIGRLYSHWQKGHKFNFNYM